MLARIAQKASPSRRVRLAVARHVEACRSQHSDTNGSSASTSAGGGVPPHGCESPLRHPAQRDPLRHRLVDEMVRVDQAGEVGAVEIYAGQLWMLRGSPEHSTLLRMKQGEEIHLRTLNRIAAQRRVRPTLLLPLWRAAGFALGAGSAALGKEAAMACTVAVETVIGEHYNDQIRELLKHGYADEKELTGVFRQHRDEELEHLDTAMRHGAQQAPFYAVLTNVIKAGCRVAVEVAKRV